MTSIEAFGSQGRSVARGRGDAASRRTDRALNSIEDSMRIRAARVQATSIVQTVKLHEIDFLAREAMSGHAMLRQWADVLSGPDPLLADELKFFTDVARMGKGEILADTISDFCNEGRR